MGLGGERAEVQPVRDLGVGLTGGDQCQDLALAWRELVQAGVLARAAGWGRET